MKLAELLIELKADTASLHKSLDKADKNIRGFATKAQNALSGIGLALGGAGLVSGFYEAAKATGQYAAKIDMASQATGIGTMRMSGLALQAKTLGVPLENITMGLAYFDKVASGLMRSKQGMEAFKTLGISIHQANGHIKKASVLFDEVTDKMSKMKDSVEKTAIAGAFFGQGYGEKMIPMLNGGVAGMRAATKAAKQLGLALSEKDAVALHRMSDSLVLSQERFRGLEMEVGRRVLPLLSNFLNVVSKDGDTWHIVWDNIVQVAATAVADLMKLLGYIPKALMLNDKAFEKAAANAKNWADQMGTDALLRAQHRDAVLKALDTMNKSKHVPLINTGAGRLVSSHAHADAEKAAQQFENVRIKMLDRLNDMAQKQANGHTGIDALVRSFQKLNAEILATGSNAMGLGITFKAAFQQAAMAAAGISGGQLGGATPGFQARGFGAMRFDIEKLKTSAHDLGKEMSQSFTRMIESGQGFKQMLGDLLRQFETFLLKATVFKDLGSGLSGKGGIGGMIGSFFSGLSLPGRAAGGPVTAGQFYMVGEEGPELFALGMSGSVLPGGISGRGGDTYNIDARGGAPGVEHRIMRVLAAMQKRSIGQSLAATYEYKMRGGTL